ncbi:Proteinase inhibitor I13, potato inhibitor I [Corchorus capsularis]|uniref:Proteinase inhibitor I13, potato inhibitor I n=1 Tax=Corchorus capsularis TaxID=210143 RepID=A0A1R3I7G8_COCAP|nr:Proteinase inhibitor I13, potato inhibitor I [Corchorus capsularis]
MSIRCPGKNSWPELVGKNGESAKETIERENSNVRAIVLPEGSIVTKDFRCNRISWAIQVWKLTQHLQQEKKVRQREFIKAEIMSRCHGKNTWPELLGKSGETAKATVERENSNVSAIVLLEGTPVTRDFRCNRVRIFVNQHGHVVQVPHVG